MYIVVHFEKRRLHMATTKKRIQVTFTDEQLEMLEKMAKEKGFTKSAILALALEEYEKLQKNA